MSKRLNTGGSQGEPVRFGSMPFFFPDVKAVELITKNVYGVRLLPAFQRDDSGAPVSPTSWIPYRDAGNVEGNSGKPPFTAWYFSFKGYKFIGNDGRGFLSPLTMERHDKRGVDPLFDCYQLAHNSKEAHPEWYALTVKAEGEKNATLEKYRVFCAANALMEVDRNPMNRLIVVTKVSLDDLKEQLDVLCNTKDQPNDPDWSDFLLGDITSPHHGLWGTVQKGTFNKAGMEASLFSFSRSRDRLVNVVKYPVDPNSSWGMEVLAGRYDIADLERVTRIASAEEILEFIVNDGFLPEDLIHEACSPTWDVPIVKGRRTSGPRSFPEQSAAEENQGGSFVKPKTPPATAPGVPVAQPPVSQRRFWVLMPDGRPSAQLIPESAVRAMVNSHGQDMQLVLEGTDVWCLASSFGIVKTVTPPPAAALQPATAPTTTSSAPSPAAALQPATATTTTSSAPPARIMAPPVPTMPAIPAPAPAVASAPPIPRQAASPAPTQAPPAPMQAPPAPMQAPPAPMQAPPVPVRPPAPPAPMQAPPAPMQAPPAPPATMQAPPAPPAPTQAPPIPATVAQPVALPMAAPAAPVSSGVLPLTNEERAELAELEQEWTAVLSAGKSVSQAKTQRYYELSERALAAQAR